MRVLVRLLSTIAAAALVAGCAAQGPFPSLAPRAVERELSGAPLPPCIEGAEAAEAAATSAPVPAPTVADPALVARIDQLLAAARQGDSAFGEALAAADTAASRAGDSGSESWIAAQIALSEAEMARTPTATALAELTALALEERAGPANPLDRQAIERATEEVRSLADRQTERLEALKASLSDL